MLPLISLCLLALGATLLTQELWLDVDSLVGAGIALLQASIRVVALYIGTLMTLLYLPTLAVIGVALLVIAGRQAIAGHGLSWHVWLGAALLLLLSVTILYPSEGRAIVPIVLIAMGAALAAGTAPAPEPAPDRRGDRGY